MCAEAWQVSECLCREHVWGCLKLAQSATRDAKAARGYTLGFSSCACLDTTVIMCPEPKRVYVATPKQPLRFPIFDLWKMCTLCCTVSAGLMSFFSFISWHVPFPHGSPVCYMTSSPNYLPFLCFMPLNFHKLYYLSGERLLILPNPAQASAPLCSYPWPSGSGKSGFTTLHSSGIIARTLKKKMLPFLLR